MPEWFLQRKKRGFYTAPQKECGIFYLLLSEQLKLLRRFGRVGPSGSIKDLHAAELLVGDGEDAHMSFLGQQLFNPPDVHIGILPARTVPQVDGKLEHGKAVAHDILAEPRGNFPVFFRHYRKIKKNEYPQDPVFIKATGRSINCLLHDPCDIKG